MPGARTPWHRHPLGQTVFVTEGMGLCNAAAAPVEVIRPGDRVYFEADEEHWHGATPSRLMVHLALNEGDDEHVVVQWPRAGHRRGVQLHAGHQPGVGDHALNSRTRPTDSAGRRSKAPDV